MTGGRHGAEALGGTNVGGRPPSSALEKDLRELERLLKADQQTGVPSTGGTGGGAGTSTVKQQLRSVLRKLMEAYFNPLNGETDATSLLPGASACVFVASSGRREVTAPPRQR